MRELIPSLELYQLDLMNSLPKSSGQLQQTRGFVFLATAAMAAEIHDCDKIIVGETGPIMFQPKFSTTDIVTRTTHPVLLRLSEKLFGELFHKDIRIFTPFENNTKAEMISLLPQEIKTNQMPSFDSCMNTHGEKMCGSCYSCVVRRFGSIVANANDEDFQYDITAYDNPKKLLHLASLLEFCIKIIEGFRGISPDVLNHIKEYQKEDLFRRFAEDILSAVYLLTSKPNNNNETYLTRFAQKYLTEPSLIEELEKRINYVRQFSFQQISTSFEN